MKNYVLENGIEITETEMSNIHRHYEVECTTEYILENYDVNEDKAREIAILAIEKMNDYHLSEEEAVEEAFEEDNEELEELD